MNRYHDEIKRIEAEAEDRYDDYDEDDFDSGLEGSEDSYDEDYEGMDEEEAFYENYNRSAIGRIDPNDRTLTIVVENTGAGDAEAILFGGNENAPQPAGVTVTVQESSHNEVREESKANPFKIVGMKMSVSDALQFNNIWKIMHRTATGSETARRYQPRNATSPQNQDPRLIDDSTFEMDITGRDSLRFLQMAGQKSVLTFTIRARANMGNVLTGHNVAELSTAPRTTGLPQIDMLQQKPAPVFGIRQTGVRKVPPRKPHRRPFPRRWGPHKRRAA